MERFVGKKAPYFKMEAVTGDGEKFFEASIDDYKGRWLVMFFYPMDFTFVCPTEITGFSDVYDHFKGLNADVLGISTDSKYCHQTWIQGGLGSINFPLAADKTMSTARDYGVLIEEEGVALRGLFIIDPDQVVRYSVIHDNNIGRSMQETLRVLKALQTGGLCGANWTEGEDTLHPKATETVTSPVPANTGAAVKVYSMPDCSYCKKVKDYLTEQGVAYDSINLAVDKEGQAFMDKGGYTRLPVTVVNGEVVEGFQLEKIKKLLK